jgi:hypothetical protein
MPRLADTRGTARRLLATATIGTCAKRAAVTGRVDACAARHTAAGAATPLPTLGTFSSIQARSKGANTTIPSTAQTDIVRPAENARVGSSASITTRTRDNATIESLRRPTSEDIWAAATSPRARTAEG